MPRGRAPIFSRILPEPVRSGRAPEVRDDDPRNSRRCPASARRVHARRRLIGVVVKRLKKIVLWVLSVVAAIAVVFVSAVLVRSNRTFDAPYPDVTASTDPLVIERGRYLAYGPAHCVNCHTPNDEEEAIKAGATPLLRGGHRFDLPFGAVYSRNLTPDAETGIGRYSDRELARVLRH